MPACPAQCHCPVPARTRASQTKYPFWHYHPPGRPDTITPEGVNCLYQLRRTFLPMTAWGIFWGRTNALDPWITSHCSSLPGCILHSSALCLYISFARVRRARVSLETLGSKKKKTKAHTCSSFSGKSCVTQANPHRFSGSSQKLICYYFCLSTLFQDFSSVTFFGEGTQIRPEQISMLSFSGQKFVFF